MSFLGGKPQKSESGNKAYPWIKDTFGPGSGEAFNSGLGGIMDILGLGSDPAAGKAALDNWWNSSGGKFLLDQGVDSINSDFYARGLGQSGAAMKALEGYRQNLADTKLNEILQNFFGLSKLGLGGGGLVAQAGQYSKGSGPTQSGLGQALQLAATIGAFI